jgi:hypothetical protein
LLPELSAAAAFFFILLGLCVFVLVAAFRRFGHGAGLLRGALFAFLSLFALFGGLRRVLVFEGGCEGVLALGAIDFVVARTVDGQFQLRVALGAVGLENGHGVVTAEMKAQRRAHRATPFGRTAERAGQEKC